MAKKKSQKRTFNGMNYAAVQRANSKNRIRLKPEDQKRLKAEGYRNLGWENVIAFYQKIEELLEQDRLQEMSLEDLFLEADRIGNKYLTPAEIEDFNQKMSKEVAEIGELIDQQFPDTEIEAIDYGKPPRKTSQNKRNKKTYRTTKL